MEQQISTGIDALIEGIPEHLVRRLRGKPIGLVTNDLALTSELRRGRTVLAAQGWQVAVVFSPEHGVSGTAREGIWWPMPPMR